MAVILDLDLTLVDSSAAAALRSQRRWAAVFAAIPRFRLYEGVPELLQLLATHRVPTCIVTSSPSMYCERVLRHFRIAADHMVCYHDTRMHKPHPAPIRLGVQRLGRPAEEVWAIGDEPRDIVSARAAGTLAVAALWGSLDRASLHAAAPDIAFETPLELCDRLRSDLALG